MVQSLTLWGCLYSIDGANPSLSHRGDLRTDEWNTYSRMLQERLKSNEERRSAWSSILPELARQSPERALELHQKHVKSESQYGLGTGSVYGIFTAWAASVFMAPPPADAKLAVPGAEPADPKSEAKNAPERLIHDLRSRIDALEQALHHRDTAQKNP